MINCTNPNLAIITKHSIALLCLCNDSVGSRILINPQTDERHWVISVVTLKAEMYCWCDFVIKSCSLVNTVSAMWWQLEISYFGFSTLTRWQNPVSSTTDNSWSSWAIYWLRASVIFIVCGLSLDIFSYFSSVCCKVGCCCCPLLSLAKSLNSALCLLFRYFYPIALKELFFSPLLYNLAYFAVRSTFVLNHLS